MPPYRNVTLSEPFLAPSQVRFRLGLVRQRTRTYPLDSMDFIMMDLERPEGQHRHAYQCAGDLTGRRLEFLSHAEGVDGHRDSRLPELFVRILRQRQPSGLFGRILGEFPKDAECLYACARVFPGLIYYYELTNDARALDAAVGLAELTLRSRGVWSRHLQDCGGRSIPFWITEPMALLYGVTGRPAYLDFVGMINDKLEMPDKGAHAHGYMATLRGLQTATLITGDAAWNAKPDAARRMIIERHFELADGCTPECFPHSGANEGCSIADWLMLNLNTAAITGDDAAYEHAEHILWNALAFNQWNTGCFGTRSTSPVGYSMRRFEECWWCCLQHGGALLKYGPLVLAPAIYSWQGEGNGCYTAAVSEVHAPTGYIPESMPGGLPILDLPKPDADGLLTLSVQLRYPGYVEALVFTNSEESPRADCPGGNPRSCSGCTRYPAQQVRDFHWYGTEPAEAALFVVAGEAQFTSRITHAQERVHAVVVWVMAGGAFHAIGLVAIQWQIILGDRVQPGLPRGGIFDGHGMVVSQIGADHLGGIRVGTGPVIAQDD